jgi:predicted DNA-binding transcriptional regulator YafY
MIKAWSGGTMAGSVEAALEKLMGALPAERRAEAETTRIFAPGYGMGREVKDVFDTLHAALGRHAVARLSYRDAQGQLTERCIQPLGLFFWGQVWLVAAWCEHRQDYRTFRLDRCVKVDILERHFAESAERSLADFMRKVRGSTD